ncbi:MAG: hypothetical protein ABSC88_06015 [Terracidiphilus sp.]|jgi:hypothetical protein
MNRFVFALVLAEWAAVSALGQQCPQSSATGPDYGSVVQTLEGRLVFHDGIRQWFELQLDQPQCGQASIELVPGNSPQLQALRGCRVRSTGSVGFSPTGYYSLPISQMLGEIEPIGKCDLKAPFPDYSDAKPDKAIRAYRVEMHVDLEPGDHPILVRVLSSWKELRPWQAYASYLLTGGFVLYGKCAKGFIVDRVFGTRQAHPSHFSDPRTPDDMAMFDPPEKPVASGVKDLHLGYTCLRER